MRTSAPSASPGWRPREPLVGYAAEARRRPRRGPGFERRRCPVRGRGGGAALLPRCPGDGRAAGGGARHRPKGSAGRTRRIGVEVFAPGLRITACPDRRGLSAHHPGGMAGGHRAPDGAEAGAGPYRAGARGTVGHRLPAADHPARTERDSQRELPKRRDDADEASPDPLPGTQTGCGTSAPLRNHQGVSGAFRTRPAGGSAEAPGVRGRAGGGRSGPGRAQCTEESETSADPGGSPTSGDASE